MKQKVRKAVIPAAGFGTRFLPATKAVPKEMLPILDKPSIQYIVEEAIDSGIEQILIITARGKNVIENHFDYSKELEMMLEQKGKKDLHKLVVDVSEMADIHYIRQKEQKGLGHAVLCARTFVGDEPFAVMLPDDLVYNDENPCLKQMMNCYDKYQKSILGVQSVPLSDVSKYGIVDGTKCDDRVYSVHSMVEKPDKDVAPSNVAILSRYIITPDIFDILSETKAGVGGEIQLTDALKTLAQKDEMYAYEFEGRRYDVGNKLGFLYATVETALRNNEIKDEFMDYLKDIVK